jgi:hypothetical protein
MATIVVEPVLSVEPNTVDGQLAAMKAMPDPREGRHVASLNPAETTVTLAAVEDVESPPVVSAGEASGLWDFKFAHSISRSPMLPANAGALHR